MSCWLNSWVIRMEKLAIILVNYNGKQYNEACIDSILAGQSSCDKSIIVVDNASQDDSMELLRKRYNNDARIELIALEDNYGFSYANNVGIRRAIEEDADYVLLLNNDTEIDVDMLARLEECAQRHPDSMIVPKIYYSDRRDVIWSAGGKVSPLIRKVSHIGVDQVDRGQFEEEAEIAFATGCALMIPKGVIEQAGLLDEDFFLYYEDTEYSFRLTGMGISIYYCPKAVMYHKVGASTKGADSPLCAYYIARNWLLCNRKHLGRRYPVFLIYFALNRLVCCLLWLVHGKIALVQATIRGIADYRKKVFGRARY
ncbi:MAG: glycosyltransferase family 2 protein [Lachnospiraceae bacterium]|nr:glycosyltransferase family 2 protein [Lachnospiraceae bacterium]